MSYYTLRFLRIKYTRIRRWVTLQQENNIDHENRPMNVARRFIRTAFARWRFSRVFQVERSEIEVFLNVIMGINMGILWCKNVRIYITINIFAFKWVFRTLKFPCSVTNTDRMSERPPNISNLLFETRIKWEKIKTKWFCRIGVRSKMFNNENCRCL